MDIGKFFIGKVFILLLVVAGCSQAIAAWDGETRTEPAIEKIGGKDYYIIKTEENLAWFAAYTNDKKNGKLDVNAKIEAKYLDMGHKLFVPIAAGKGERKFNGIFDGNRATIANLYINSEELIKIDSTYGQNIGLVAAMTGSGTVKNVFLENVDIRAASDIGSIIKNNTSKKISVGTLVGWMEKGSVEGCFASGIIYNSGKGQAVGGIVGNADKGTIKDCLSTVSINIAGNDSYVGGIIGQAKTSVTIAECVYDSARFVNDVAASTGGVMGLRQNGVNAENNYFDNKNISNGVAEGETQGVEGKYDLNTEENTCTLNGGTWDKNTKTCDKTGVWANGDERITNNGVGKDNLDSTVYTIFFDANGGEFSSNAKTSKTFNYKVPLTIGEISKPFYADSSKVFSGWAFEKNATEPLEDFGLVLGVDTLYAVWKNTIQVTFNENHGTFPKTVVKRIAVGDTIVATEKFDSYKVGEDDYYLAGWALTKTATEPLKQLDVAVENVTYYAVWTKNPTYTVTFDNNGLGTDVMSQQIKENGKATEPSLDADGYIFGGWYTEAACTNKFDFNTAITADTKLYAKWTEVTYTITYKLNGGENSSDNPSEYKVTSKTIVLKNPVDRENYRFGGWYYDSTLTERAVQITEGSFGDVVLYAKWALNEYLVSYAAGSYGYGIVANSKKIHGETLQLSSSTYTYYNVGAADSEKNVYYSQDGWALSDTGKVAYKLGGDYKTDSSITLYPHWVKGMVVVYNDKGDTIIVQINIDDTEKEVKEKVEKSFNNHEPKISTPTKTAKDTVYVFVGWKQNEESGWYEPEFSSEVAYKINFHLPEGAVLTESFAGYRYGEVTKLPSAKMETDTTWKFKGWYTKTKGRGDHVKAMRETDSGNKSLYPLFQKTIRYEIKKNKGTIEVIYTDRADTTIARALRSVTPSAYTEDGVKYQFDKWVLDDGVYKATFKSNTVRFNVVLDARAFNIEEAQMGAHYAVFGMDGRIVRRGVVSNGSQRVEIPKSGSYTVRVNKESVQVNVK